MSLIGGLFSPASGSGGGGGGSVTQVFDAESDGLLVLDGPNRTIKNNAGQMVADFQNLILDDANGNESIDWDLHYLYSISGGFSVAWEERKLYDAVSNPALDWSDASSVHVSNELNANSLFVVNGGVFGDTINVNNAAVLLQDGTAFLGTLELGSGGYGGPVAMTITGDGLIQDTSTASTIDINARKLFANDGISTSVDWSSPFIVDFFGLAFVDFSGSANFTGLSVTTSGIVFSGLQTSDPGAVGQLWNDGGTVKIST